MRFILSEKDIKSIMLKSWIMSKSTYRGNTEDYFHEIYEQEIKKLIENGHVINVTKKDDV